MAGAELDHLLPARVPEDLGRIEGRGGGPVTVHGWVGGVGGVPVQLLRLSPAAAVDCHAAHCAPQARRSGVLEYCRISDMTNIRDLIRQLVHHIQRLLVDPVVRQLSVTLLETTGRKNGQPRHNGVGGRVVNNQFWMVSEHGQYSDYVRNIRANPAVRVRIRGRWRTGTAHLLPDDDPLQRLGELKLLGLHSALVRLMGSDLLTIRVDLD